MNPTSQTIPCPACNAPIPFTTQQLLMGGPFSCPNCYSKIGMTPGGTSMANQTIIEAEKLKDRLKE